MPLKNPRTTELGSDIDVLFAALWNREFNVTTKLQEI